MLLIIAFAIFTTNNLVDGVAAQDHRFIRNHFGSHRRRRNRQIMNNGKPSGHFKHSASCKNSNGCCANGHCSGNRNGNVNGTNENGENSINNIPFDFDFGYHIHSSESI